MGSPVHFCWSLPKRRRPGERESPWPTPTRRRRRGSSGELLRQETSLRISLSEWTLRPPRVLFSIFSYNSSSGIWYSMWVVPWLSVFVPSKPSQYFIHNNQFTPTGSYSGGVYLWNDPTNPWIRATVYDNTIEPQSTLWDGIGAYNTKGAAIWNNTITGSGADAIGLWGTTSKVRRVEGYRSSCCDLRLRFLHGRG